MCCNEFIFHLHVLYMFNVVLFAIVCVCVCISGKDCMMWPKHQAVPFGSLAVATFCFCLLFWDVFCCIMTVRMCHHDKHTLLCVCMWFCMYIFIMCATPCVIWSQGVYFFHIYLLHSFVVESQSPWANWHHHMTEGEAMCVCVWVCCATTDCFLHDKRWSEI